MICIENVNGEVVLKMLPLIDDLIRNIRLTLAEDRFEIESYDAHDKYCRIKLIADGLQIIVYFDGGFNSIEVNFSEISTRRTDIPPEEAFNFIEKCFLFFRGMD